MHACAIVAEQPWIVLEFLTHGDLKTFLTVSLTVAPSHCVKIIDNIMHNNNHTLTEKQTTSSQVGQVYAGCRYWDAIHI